MGRTVVDDRWGGRWTVRARHERHAEPDSEYTRRLREPSLRAELRPMLAPPTGSGSVLPVAGRAPAVDLSDIRFTVGSLSAQPAAPAAAIGTAVAIWQYVRILRQPSDRFWVVELTARGRIRRGATWKVAGREEAARVAAVVADAVRTGQVPEPSGALLIDVVDERLTVYGAPR
jgi:hypothetical protein